MKISVFGDSIGKGVILDNVAGRYKALKLELLEPLSRYKEKINYSNYAKFGHTITKGMSLIERYQAEISSYDYVILEYGGNDCNFQWNVVAQDPCKDHEPNTPLDKFIETYKSVIEKIQATGSQPVMLTLPPLNAKNFFKAVTKGIDANSIKKFMVTEDRIYRWQEMYNLAVVKLAKKLSVPIIDIRSEFLHRADFEELIGEDGMHPSKKGYELIVKTVVEHMASPQMLVNRIRG
ncbi:MAG: SGNH/GDSL hydrolase family protein [Eubacteriaceae bacterium]|nr:SGNH/GDSL hydrolase family protein [Eubacteriaceae bacterium]